MRTTVNLEDDVISFAKGMAEAQSISLGQALSELARRGMKARVGTRRDAVSGLVVFDLPSNVPKITPEEIQEVLDLEGLGEFGDFFPQP